MYHDETRCLTPSFFVSNSDIAAKNTLGAKNDQEEKMEGMLIPAIMLFATIAGLLVMARMASKS
ncbi:hypothetical protein [Methylosinus sp. Ce-a6]|uniref:hypothetical protein n=1 Tax=Methylosinus sp. Ce-a6 TaxID=2172005 RepID=UPI00135994F2|nr:hypothetical protein [Methylosinus sp. Ce-a6]